MATCKASGMLLPTSRHAKKSAETIWNVRVSRGVKLSLVDAGSKTRLSEIQIQQVDTMMVGTASAKQSTLESAIYLWLEANPMETIEKPFI
jgi:hypothetical protein